MNRLLALLSTAAVFLSGCASSSGNGAPATTSSGAAANPMSFFVTSVNPGKGADLGGLEGADRHCQMLASATGAGGRTWHAYLSTTAGASGSAVDARDRIGSGPWQNAKGVVIARNVDELHGASNNLNKQTALNERGEVVNGRGDPVNTHDILTGSAPEGRASATGSDTTCSNWTSSDQGSAIVGHHDRQGLRDDPPSHSWNSSHTTPGCSPDALKKVGGGGLLYCFAVN